jgi:excisionase family DNA binding protein
VTGKLTTDPVAALAELVAERITARGPSVARVALTRQEAARAIGVSVDHFERHILAGLRTIRTGRLVLVPVAELERWARDQAAFALAEHHRAARPSAS